MQEPSWINEEVGIARFSGHTEIYLKYLKKLLENPDYEALCTAMQQQECEAAFRAAHTLKGVTGNLSLDRFYASLCPFVDQLRENADFPGATADFPALQQLYTQTIEKVQEYLQQH